MLFDKKRSAKPDSIKSTSVHKFTRRDVGKSVIVNNIVKINAK